MSHRILRGNPFKYLPTFIFKGLRLQSLNLKAANDVADINCYPEATVNPETNYIKSGITSSCVEVSIDTCYMLFSMIFLHKLISMMP